MTDDLDQPGLADSQLDKLLARSAPPVSTASPQVRHDVRLLVQAAAVGSQPASRRHRRTTRRLALGVGATAMTFVGVTAAAASPSAPGWLAWADWTPDATVADTPGRCAMLGLKVVPDGAGADDPGVVAARQYLAGLDLDDVDYADELVEQRAVVMTEGEGVPTGATAGELYSDAELEYRAYTDAINRMVYAEVERRGLDTSHVSIEGRANGCDEELFR